jgi:hypothetical protein
VCDQLHVSSTLSPRKEPRFVGGLVGPRNSVNTAEKRNIPLSCRKSNLNPSAVNKSTDLPRHDSIFGDIQEQNFLFHFIGYLPNPCPHPQLPVESVGTVGWGGSFQQV